MAGGAFLRRFARVSGGCGGDWKCAFCLTRDGKPVKIQRTIFSECFYILAMDELSRVTGDTDMQVGIKEQDINSEDIHSQLFLPWFFTAKPSTQIFLYPISAYFLPSVFFSYTKILELKVE